MTIAELIKSKLAEKKMSARAASLAAGLAPDAVRDIVVGRSKFPRSDTLWKLSQVLGIEPSQLFDDQRQRGQIPPAAAGEVILPIRYEVAAGMWRHHEDLELDIEPETFPATRVPPFEYMNQWLERVRGDSVNKLIPDGGLAHVVDAIELGYAPRRDDIVVVVRSRAQGAFIERTIKQVDIAPNGEVELWPRSFNPKWDAPMMLAEGLREGEDAEVQIVGLVIRAYLPFISSR